MYRVEKKGGDLIYGEQRAEIRSAAVLVLERGHEAGRDHPADPRDECKRCPGLSDPSAAGDGDPVYVRGILSAGAAGGRYGQGLRHGGVDLRRVSVSQRRLRRGGDARTSGISLQTAEPVGGDGGRGQRSAVIGPVGPCGPGQGIPDQGRDPRSGGSSGPDGVCGDSLPAGGFSVQRPHPV